MECFGSDDEEESIEPIKRDASCGICSFHPHTESSLLSHVRNSLASTQTAVSVDHKMMNAYSLKLEKAEQVLKSVDAFCMQRHWMMHVGPEKGKILSKTLKETIDVKLSSSNEQFVLVELGSYCGYSSILMARECFVAYGTKMNVKLITCEINPEFFGVAKELIKLSGLDDVISLVEVSYNGHSTNMVDLLRDELKPIHYDTQNAVQKTIDLLFIDHDKDSYKSDLMDLEASGLIRCGTRVVADNVVFAQINDYVKYVQKRQQDGVVTTKTIPCQVEYSNGEVIEGNSESLVDGIGKSCTDPYHYSM